MKKLYSTITMLAMMVAALGLTACGGSGDDDEIGGDGGGSSTFLIGTWSVTSGQGWGGYTGDGEAEYLQFKSNGTYINVQFDDGLYITKGNWSATDTELVMKETEGNILGTYTYKILNHTESSMTLKMWGITVNLTKVPDSTIDKYLNGGGSSTSSTFTILQTYQNGNEEPYTYDNEYAIKALCAEFENLKLFERTSGSYFSLMYPKGYLYIVFPSSKYGKDLDASYFSQGFSDFGEDATEIVRIDPYSAGWYGHYLSGSAKVVKNDGRYITVTFNNYEVYIKRTPQEIKIKLNGTLSFENKVK